MGFASLQQAFLHKEIGAADFEDKQRKSNSKYMNYNYR